jgi:orotate phosphoribosyltransferase
MVEKEAREVAAILLDRRAVIINTESPFTFSSGITSPIYCDLRQLCAYPVERERITALLVARISETAAEIVAGVATAGIPWAAWASSRLGRSMAYVRDGAKGHGRGRQVEGVIEQGSTAVLVEDLTSTAGSAIRAVEGLRTAGAEITRSYSIFSYEFEKAKEAYREAQVELTTLCGISDLLELAVSERLIESSQAAAVRAWLSSDPMSQTGR